MQILDRYTCHANIVRTDMNAQVLATCRARNPSSRPQARSYRARRPRARLASNTRVRAALASRVRTFACVHGMYGDGRTCAGSPVRARPVFAPSGAAPLHAPTARSPPLIPWAFRAPLMSCVDEDSPSALRTRKLSPARAHSRARFSAVRGRRNGAWRCASKFVPP